MNLNEIRKKVLFVVAQTNFRDEEYFQPKSVLENAGINTVTASYRKGEVTSIYGKKVQSDISLKDAKAKEYAAVIFVGGAGSKIYFEDPVAHKIAQEMIEKGKIVAAICIAPTTIAKAGLLKGRKATSFHSSRSDIESAGGIFTGKPVEKDGNIITASGSEAAVEFGNSILKAIT